MKKIAFLCILVISIISCKSDESGILIEGEFLYVDGAGVLMGKDFIYGVSLNDVTEELIKQAASKQRDKFDMVPVIIRGEINPKPQGTDSWDEIVTIKEIIKVLEPKGEAPIKIETGK